MNAVQSLTQKSLAEYLLHVAVIRPVFIWGPPGIGKSSIVQQFAKQVGLPCVSLLGSQLAPEDLIGVPQIIDGKSRFCPPTMIAREEPYCLFLDELNACSHEVQKAFYSLIHERRIGEYELPPGSIVIGAGNRAQDSAIVKPMSSALINRMIHVQLQASHQDWLEWAHQSQVHPVVLEYIRLRPDHLWSAPPKHEEPFSTPRSWYMLSDALKEYGDEVSDSQLEVLAYGCLSPAHAGQFKAYVKQTRSKYRLTAILRGELGWPHRAGSASHSLGRGAGPVVRQALLSAGEAPHVHPAQPAPVGHARHPPPALGAAGGLPGGEDLRGGAGHLRLDGPQAAGQGAGSHRQLQPVPGGRACAARLL